MASFSVTVTSNTTPAINITLSGTTTYAQFKNSLGNFIYKPDQIYSFSTNQNQIKGGFSYSKYDSGGNQNLQTILSTIDPYQYQNSIFLDVSKKNLVIDGRDYVRFNMYPNTSLSFKLYCQRIANQDNLQTLHENNFQVLEFDSDMKGYFEQYKEYL
jgi:hypothetical protein